ncbi:hypothetical protein RN001_000304 [Aquatica leii]|uniref:Uncharacterized protein n=1 Tax=Aquatica leii TaxID=1421715 RepID=A0AAN7PF54_9COLE|nr:hypothetical protein RN001_000304 [Aquatica leii]
MELTFVILLTIFFIVAITMLILLFGDPRNIFSSTEPLITSTSISSIDLKTETKDLYPRMPSPPPHLIQGMQRAPSLNTPYPKNPPPLGFEHISTIPEAPQLESFGPLPYPMGEIPQMPQPLDTGVPYYIPNNEWSYIEEQIVREVASEPEPHQHPPSYEEAINDNDETLVRQRSRH